MLVARDDDVTPPSPFSYFFPLMLIMVACGGYIYWKRMENQNRSGRALPLNFPTPAQTGIRLSEDGPPATMFTHDNASTDSLPAHALQEIPELRQPTPTTYFDRNSLPLSGLSNSTTDKPIITASNVGSKRRSAKGKMKGSIEIDDDTESEGDIGKSRFGIGGDDDLSDTNSENSLGPLGRQ
ncbi:uncharacterized protein L201_005349 [Kwoniella dendrophila CBS 6074]|uniref:Uncharacterized protein n=1 Tax=Kwoniella dendrophila CBS 6074 TaxID=1295534 RepID=A0AAX4JZX6_9TREE